MLSRNCVRDFFLKENKSYDVTIVLSDKSNFSKTKDNGKQ